MESYFLANYLLLCIFLSLSLISIHRFYRRCRLRLPPGTMGMPLIGETLHLISAYKTENPEPFIDGRVKRFGSVFTTHIFGEPTIFSTDPQVNRFVLVNEGKIFECSYPRSITNLLGKHSLVSMKGGIHKRMHALTMSFGSSWMIRDHFLVHIDRLVRQNMDAWGSSILLMEEAKKITFELTLKQLMSKDPGEWTESIRKEYVLVIEGFFTVPWPLFSATYRRAFQARTNVAKALKVVVNERRKEMVKRKENKIGEKKLDMLESLLEMESSGGIGGGFSDEEIADFMVALLVAGYETTSTTMTLAVKFLAQTPLALAHLKEEHEQIRAKKKNGEALHWSDYTSMHFTQCVVNETLRVANIISGVFRRTTTDVNIKGYTIPKGCRVFASFRAVHLDHSNFKDARTFNPLRWQSNSGAMTSPASLFTPFGGGPRLCPGYELARVELSVFLHHLVTNFSWVPAEEDKLVFFPTTRTQKRFPIILQRLNAA